MFAQAEALGALECLPTLVPGGSSPEGSGSSGPEGISTTLPFLLWPQRQLGGAAGRPQMPELMTDAAPPFLQAARDRQAGLWPPQPGKGTVACVCWRTRGGGQHTCPISSHFLLGMLGRQSPRGVEVSTSPSTRGQAFSVPSPPRWAKMGPPSRNPNSATHMLLVSESRAPTRPGWHCSAPRQHPYRGSRWQT